MTQVESEEVGEKEVERFSSHHVMTHRSSTYYYTDSPRVHGRFTPATASALLELSQYVAEALFQSGRRFDDACVATEHEARPPSR
jgi:hypothetical protein